ncbi:exocyst complex component EXO70A1-like [Corylus avellana]|uniref:exocyst complex component EXO70A1-like n=1 Tax=Corylus avellana TaxID=13451 RepID=UPI001E1F162B|nr:exocyst complex component EXO70A1-like [Corylus avellana]
MAKVEEEESFQNLVSARQLLESSLQKSRALASAVDETGLRLEMISQRLPSLEAAARSIISLQKCAFHIDPAIAAAAAVLKVFHTARELQKSLLSYNCSDDHLFNYLSLMNRLQQVLRFLADNCRLAIKWLEGIVEHMEDYAITNDWYLSNVKKSLGILQDLQAKEESLGILSAAFQKLEIEFKRLLMENSVPLALASLATTCNVEEALNQSCLPAPTIQKLQAILVRLNSNSQLGMCISVYVDVRSSNAKRSLRALGLDYLDMSITKFDDEQGMEEDYIEKWSKHLVLAVKYLFELEYRLCNEVFKKIGSDVGMSCFAKIAAQSGILEFLQFGKHVTESSNKDAIKMLKLLDMFASLDNLRLDFNRLFRGEDCTEIQNQTRDLIRRIVDGACQIFWQLPLQVELQRGGSPPSDGSLPRLVSFVTSYCNQLLGDEYRPIMAQVLVIHHSWKQESYEEGLISYQVCKIMKAIGVNLDRWSKAYEDISLSYLFMMNNHCHFCNLKGTKLGDVMGDSWLTAHGQYTDYYAALYLRESWGNLVTLVSQKSLQTSLAGQDLVKKRLKAFNDAFDERYKKQSKWIICNENLRKKVCQHLEQAILPVYQSYMQNYRPLVEQDVKYSVQNLEKLLSCMFQPTITKYWGGNNGDLVGNVEYKSSAAWSLGNMLSALFPQKLSKYGRTKRAQWMNRMKNSVTNQFRFSLTAI